jgi:hypothetical protein
MVVAQVRKRNDFLSRYIMASQQDEGDCQNCVIHVCLVFRGKFTQIIDFEGDMGCHKKGPARTGPFLNENLLMV